MSTEEPQAVPETEVQQHYRDIMSLKKAKVDLSPQQIADETGGQLEDLKGIHPVIRSQELLDLGKKAEDRRLSVAGMSPLEDDSPIGFAQMLKDVRKLIRTFMKK